MTNKFWNDERGGVITTELVLVASTTVAILLSGLGVIRSGIQAEFDHVGDAIQNHRTHDLSGNESKPSINETQQEPPAAYVEIFRNEDRK